MQFLTDKNGALSPFRMSIAAGAFGLLMLAISVIGFFLDQESRRTPYFPPVPAGVEQWGYPVPEGNYRQQIYYRTQSMPVEEVAAFYNDQMLAHYGNNASDPEAEQCQRFPETGTFADEQVNSYGERVRSDYDPLTQPAYHYTCMFDRSGFNTSQWTQVTIYPGIPNADPALDSQGYTVIWFQQEWSN
ncbi:MAG: hypothetical protein KC546_04225 [Anaerolineae bacterium]|nr:hypothetical protein [Anaerolineae bacterium]MCB9461618.1 hypothetical protein [Anaerolineaceae bacterium]